MEPVTRPTSAMTLPAGFGERRKRARAVTLGPRRLVVVVGGVCVVFGGLVVGGLVVWWFGGLVVWWVGVCVEE